MHALPDTIATILPPPTLRIGYLIKFVVPCQAVVLVTSCHPAANAMLRRGELTDPGNRGPLENVRTSKDINFSIRNNKPAAARAEACVAPAIEVC